MDGYFWTYNTDSGRWDLYYSSDGEEKFIKTFFSESAIREYLEEIV